MRFLQRAVLVLILTLGLLVKPTAVSAEFLEVTSPAEIYQETAFEIDVKISVQPTQSYKIKARIGADSSHMTKGQTFDTTNGVWLSDSVSWDKFPTIETTSEGSWQGKLKVKSTATASLGSNLLQVRIQKLGTSSQYNSPDYSITILQPKVQEIEAPLPTKIEGKPVLSEFMAQPLDKIEWVELRNDGDNPADIAGWKIDDEEGKATPQTIPDNTVIPAKGFFVLNFTSFKLNDLSDSVRLLKPDNNVVENFTYEKTVRGQSWSKDNNGVWFITSDPTPGTANKFTYVSETPDTSVSPNQKPEETVNNAVLAATTENSTLQAPLPKFDASNKIATVSPSFVNQTRPNTPQRLFFFIFGGVAVAASFIILFKNYLRKFLLKRKSGTATVSKTA